MWVKSTFIRSSYAARNTQRVPGLVDKDTILEVHLVTRVKGDFSRMGDVIASWYIELQMHELAAQKTDVNCCAARSRTGEWAPSMSHLY